MNSPTKRQVLPPGLWVVATPIGNLADLSPRARQAIEEADALLCEDTRSAQRLLASLGPGMERPGRELFRLDAHAGEGAIRRVIERLREGAKFALLTDAGTPAVSDPGSVLVQAARREGVIITPIPGPSAVSALVSVLGFSETAFTFRGFFPRKAGERREELKRLEASPAVSSVFIWFESPHRIVEALQSVADAWPEAEVVAAKELTKVHERIFSGSSVETTAQVRAEIASEGEVGEWCFAAHLQVDEGTSQSSEWVKALQCLLNARVSAPEAAKQVSHVFGVDRREAYERVLQLSGKKSAEET